MKPQSYDTDCNVGNVGTIMGVLYGADQIPAKWKDPIRDTFRTFVKGFEETRISKIADRICNVGVEVIKSKCQNIQIEEWNNALPNVLSWIKDIIF